MKKINHTLIKEYYSIWCKQSFLFIFFNLAIIKIHIDTGLFVMIVTHYLIFFFRRTGDWNFLIIGLFVSNNKLESRIILAFGFLFFFVWNILITDILIFRNFIKCLFIFCRRVARISQLIKEFWNIFLITHIVYSRLICYAITQFLVNTFVAANRLGFFNLIYGLL